MCREYRSLLRLLRSFCSLMIGSTTRDYTVVRFTQYFTFIGKKFVPEEKEIEICFVYAISFLCSILCSANICNVRYLVIDIQLSVKIEFIINKICRRNIYTYILDYILSSLYIIFILNNFLNNLFKSIS